MSTENEVTEAQKIVVNPVEVQAMLDKGMKRAEIGAFYGMNKANTARIFRHPDLIGKKTKGISRPGSRGGARERPFVFADGVKVEDVEVTPAKLKAKKATTPAPTSAPATAVADTAAVGQW